MPPEVYEEVMRRGVDVHSKSNRYDAHHAILSRKDVQGLPQSEQSKIHSKYNLLVIPKEDNASHANIPDRITAIRMLHKHYRLRDIEAWYASINFKSRPFRFPKMTDLYPDTETV
jgi:hypothetical protein